MESKDLSFIDFLVIGAAKSGTTFVHDSFSQHPEICVPCGMKETFYLVPEKQVLGNGKHFLEENMVCDKEQFTLLYQSNESRKASFGEVCAAYLYFYKETIPNIKKRIGDPKIIIILRDPVNRAYSGYLHLIRENIIKETFRETIDREPARISENWWWGYRVKDIGFYFNSVKAYCEAFSRVKIFFFEDLVSNPKETMRNMYDFLGVDPRFMAEIINRNKTGVPKVRFLDNILFKNNPINRGLSRTFVSLLGEKKKKLFSSKLRDLLLARPKLDERIRKELTDDYSGDVERLQKYLKLDRLGWLRNEV